MSLKPLFKDAWKIVWNNPLLWLWGIFAAFLTNNEINLLFINFKRINNWIDQLVIFDFLKKQGGNSLNNVFSLNFSSLYNSPIILIFLIIFLFIFLSIFSEIIIILAIKNWVKGQKNVFSTLWKNGKIFLFPVFGVHLLTFLIIYGFFLLLWLVFNYHLKIPLIVFVATFLILGIFISFISRFIIFFLITNNLSFKLAIKRGLTFFFKNWRSSLKISLFIYFITFLIGCSSILISIGTFFPFLLLINLFLRTGFIIGFWVLSGMIVILILLFFLFISAIFSAWQITTWVLFFLKIK